jgi:hypothetical protein
MLRKEAPRILQLASWSEGRIRRLGSQQGTSWWLSLLSKRWHPCPMAAGVAYEVIHFSDRFPVVRTACGRPGVDERGWRTITPSADRWKWARNDRDEGGRETDAERIVAPSTIECAPTAVQSPMVRLARRL